jgi:hypothetical protein
MFASFSLPCKKTGGTNTVPPVELAFTLAFSLFLR